MNNQKSESSNQKEIIEQEINAFLPFWGDSKNSAHAFHNFYLILKAYNSNVNLVSDDSFDEFLFRHVLDSLSVFKTIEIAGNETIVDIGSGAGFPGIPIKICLPSINLISVESITKKANFQKMLIAELGLTGIRIENSRAEVLAGTELREKADIVVSRALASLPTLVELSLPLLRIGGKAVFFKSWDTKEEIKSAENALCLCGGSIIAEFVYQIRPADSKRRLILIQKTNETPMKYPRRPGIPFKRPL